MADIISNDNFKKKLSEKIEIFVVCNMKNRNHSC